MVFATGLEANALFFPAHGPVDTPWEFQVATFAQVDLMNGLASSASDANAPLAVPREVEFVATAAVAEARKWEPVCRKRLRSVLIEDLADLVTSF